MRANLTQCLWIFSTLESNEDEGDETAFPEDSEEIDEDEDEGKEFQDNLANDTVQLTVFSR